MGRIFMCVLSLSLSGALTVLLILLVRSLSRRLFSRRWNYYIWLLVIARLLVPVHIDIGYSGGSLWEQFPLEEQYGKIFSEDGGFTGTLPVEKAAKGRQDLLAEAGTVKEEREQNKYEGWSGEPDANKPVSWPETEIQDIEKNAQAASFLESGIVSALWICWLLGVVFSLCVRAKDYLDFVVGLKKEYKPAAESEAAFAVESLSRRLSMKKKPLVYESGKVSAPMVVGLFKPVIVLPEREQENPGLWLAIHHELVHIKRKDLWYKWLYQMLLCIHWFNPILYLGGRKLNEDCELSCDEAVVAALTPEGKKAYGNALLDAAQKSMGLLGGVPSLPLLERKEDLKMRLKGILYYKKQGPLRAAVSLGAAGIMVFLSACGSVQVAPGAMPVQVSEDTYEGYSFWEWAAMKVGYWADSGVDGFLAQPVLVDKAGEAWQSYEDDVLLAGDDICDQWHMYTYSGGKSVRCSGMYLNGNASVLIANAKKDVEIQVHSSFNILNGSFKIIHIAPDGNVTVLNETGEKGYADVTCQEGRNVIKFVGQGAKINDLRVEYRNLQDWDFESILFSQEEEKSMIAAEKIKNGVAEKEEIMELLPYLEKETVSQAAALLFKQQAALSEEELHQLIIYSDSRLTTDYLVEAVRQGEMPPLSGDTILAIAPYLNEGDVKELLLCIEEDLTPDLISNCVPYMKGDEIREFLVDMKESLTAEIVYQNAPYLGERGLKEVLLSMGGKLTGETVCQCAPYLGQTGLGEVLLALGERGNLTGETVCQCAPYLGEEGIKKALLALSEGGELTGDTIYQCSPYLEESGLREVLLSMGEGMYFDLLLNCAPYLGESEMARCLKEYLANGNEITYSQMQRIAPYLSAKEKEGLADMTLVKPSNSSQN